MLPLPSKKCRYDKYCPFYKSVDMLRNMIAFYDTALGAIGANRGRVARMCTFACVRGSCQCMEGRLGSLALAAARPSVVQHCACSRTPCPPARAERTAASTGDGGKITYNVIKARLGDLLYKLR